MIDTADMLYILAAWAYILLTCINFGLIFKRLFLKKMPPAALLCITGSFSYLLVTLTVAFFSNVNTKFYIAILAMNLLLLIIHKNYFYEIALSIKASWIGFSKLHKLIFSIVFIACWTKSTTVPFLFDNESYYVQTIKWLNQYGFVKGLVNLHPFLGQASGWHVLQAGFNFPFFGPYFNDLNGLLLIVVSFYSIEGLSDKGSLTTERFSMGYMLLFLPILMLFVNIPSADIVSMLVGLVVLYLFQRNYHQANTDEVILLFAFTILIILSKVIMAALVLLPILLFVKHFSSLKTESAKLSGLVLVSASLLVAKNIILTGLPLFPLFYGDLATVDWKASEIILQTIQGKEFLTGLDHDTVDNMGLGEMVIRWISYNKVGGFFNLLFVGLLVVTPLIIFLKRQTRSPLIWTYLTALLHFGVLWATSPKHRFFLVFVFYLSSVSLFQVFRNRRVFNSFLAISAFIGLGLVFVPIDFGEAVNNPLMRQQPTFSLNNLLKPAPNSVMNEGFAQKSIGNMNYWSPPKGTYFWLTGNGELPCVNSEQIKFYEENYGLCPQLRSTSLSEGFYIKRIDVK